MRSIRARLLVGLLLLVTVVSLIVGSITYRRVLGEASTLFDYQLRQMAISLGEQATYLSSPYALPVNPNSDFAIQIWDIYGKRIISSPGLPFLDTATLGYSDMRGRTRPEPASFRWPSPGPCANGWRVRRRCA
jgi:two-component system OmpR family sensor kinase/two-component system sensor histidine kinase QseC